MDIQVKGNKLVIEVELTPEDQAPRSSTGKSKIAASSKGYVGVPGNDKLRVSLNVIYK